MSRATWAGLAGFFTGFLLSGLLLTHVDIDGNSRDIVFSALGFAAGFGAAIIYASRRR